MTNRQYTTGILACSAMGSVLMMCVLMLHTVVASVVPTYEVCETKVYSSFFISRWYDVFLLPPIALLYAWILRATYILCALNGVDPRPWKWFSTKACSLSFRSRSIEQLAIVIYGLAVLHGGLNLYVGLGNIIPIAFGPVAMFTLMYLIALTNIKNWSRSTE